MKNEINFICAFCGKEFKDTRSNRRFCSRECSGRSCAKDITGQVFGKLTAIKRLEESNISHRLWLCRCDCGNYTKVPINFLTKGHTKSCGCARKAKGKWKAENHPEIFEGTNIKKIVIEKPFKSNTSGVKGVHQHIDGRWIARIGFKYERIYLGIFDTFEEAAEARREAENVYYKPVIEKYNEEVGAGNN